MRRLGPKICSESSYMVPYTIGRMKRKDQAAARQEKTHEKLEQVILEVML